MAKNIPTVRHGILMFEEPADQPLEIDVGSPQWFAWLDQVSKFAVDGITMRFTARKKWRGNAAYWYVPLRRAGKRTEVYLGKSSAITLEKLRAVVEQLSPAAQPAAGLADPARMPSTVFESSSPDAVERDVEYILQLVATKTSVPPPLLGKWIMPAHAYASLSGATQRRLTLLEAPTGYGKTTLLARWIAESGVRAAWLTLEAGHNDPTRFWTHAGAALDRVMPGLLGQLLPFASPSQSQRPNALVDELVSRLAGAPDPTVLVLDDCHTLRHDNTALLEQIWHVITHAPPRVHFIISTREQMRFPLTRMMGQGQALRLSAEDLAFTRSEIAALFAQRYSVELSSEETEEQYRRTQGWPIAITLAAMAHAQPSARERTLDPAYSQDRFVSDFVVAEVLRPLPTELQDYLLQVCVLDRLCAPLCDAVTRRLDGQAMLAELLRRDLFILPLDARGEWYRFHPLFSQALQRHLNESQPGLIPALYARASEWCHANRFIRDAAEYAFAVNDFETVADLLEEHISDAWKRGRVVTLRQFIERLPTEVVRKRPRLLLAHANTLIFMHDRASLWERLRDAEEAIAQSADKLDPSELATLRSELAVQRIYAQSNLSTSTPQSRVATYETALATLPPDDATLDLATVGLGIERLLSGDVRAARARLSDILATPQSWGQSIDYAACLLYLGQATLQSGRLEEALNLGRRGFNVVAQAALEDTALSGVTDVTDVLQGYVLYERNELAAAIAHLRTLLKTSSSLPPVLKLAGFPLLAFAQQAQGKATAARDTMEKVSVMWARAQDIAPRPQAWGRRLIAAHRAHLRILQGEIASASAWARQLILSRLADAQSAKDGEVPPYIQEAESIALARVHLAEENPQAALALLDPLAVAAEAAGREGRLIEILTLRALAHAALHDQTAAHHALARAVVLAAPEGYIRTFVDAGPAVEGLLAELSSRIAAHELNSIISLHAAPSSRSPSKGATQAAEEKALLEYIRKLLAAFAPAPLATQEPVAQSAATAQGNQDTPHADRAEPPKTAALTARELAVLGALALGATNYEIAKKLYIVESTVKRHVTKIIAKLNAQNRTHAVVTAITLGLIDPMIGSGGGPPKMHPEAC